MTEKKSKQRPLLAMIVVLILVAIFYFAFAKVKSEFFTKKRLKSDFSQEFSVNKPDKNANFQEINKSTEESTSQIENLTVEKLQNGGAELIYKAIIYNQMKAREVDDKISELNRNFSSHKASEKIAKMILSYVRLRDRIYAQINYEKQIQTFEILILDDENLHKKFAIFKESLAIFKGYKDLQKKFESKIPELIALKDNKNDGDFLSKITFKLAKIVTIRKLDENNQEIDGAIARIEKYLKNQNCQDSLAEIEFLEEKYSKALSDFKKRLKAVCKFEKIDQEIMFYLESLTPIKIEN